MSAGPLAITEQQAIALFYQRNLGLIAASLNIDNAQAQEIIAGGDSKSGVQSHCFRIEPKDILARKTVARQCRRYCHKFNSSSKLPGNAGCE